MWDEKSAHLKLETGFAFKPHMKKTYVKAFNNQDRNESAVLGIKYYNPLDFIIQHLPVEEKV